MRKREQKWQKNFGFEPVNKKPYYFVSYNSDDASRVAPICVEMNHRGIPMWYDNGLIPGEEWEKQITLRIKNCTEMVMFVTQKLLEKENNYVRTEYKLANKFKKKVQIVFLDKIDFDKVNDALQSWYVGMEAKHSVEAFDLRNPQEIVTVMDILIKFDKRRLPGYMQLVPVVVPVSQPTVQLQPVQPVRTQPQQLVQPVQIQPRWLADRQAKNVQDEMMNKNNAKWFGIISITLSCISVFTIGIHLFVAIIGLVLEPV